MNVVEYLVEKCDADIEQVGSVMFDGETIDGAPPIWCAAAAGYLPIVKFLVKAGTEVKASFWCVLRGAGGGATQDIVHSTRTRRLTA